MKPLLAAAALAGVALQAAPSNAATGRCATAEPPSARAELLGTSDCSLAQTVPGPQWEPAEVIRIPVVVHVIMDAACANGTLSDAVVASQIAILNEDFRALPGAPGALGYDSRVEFFLATVDPQGQPTNGITRDCNATWYADQGQYWLTLAWDPNRYMNLYTNSANGAGGYVPFLPADPSGAVGQPQDRVVINWLAVGRDGPVPAHNQGRIATHEVGHYLGLFHPYFQGCGVATPPDCYTSGDRICDTAPDAAEHHGCVAGSVSCGTFPVPIENYMELTDDTCKTGFTHEQARRIRCTLATYRPNLAPPDAVFYDGFASGDLSAWTAHVP